MSNPLSVAAARPFQVTPEGHAAAWAEASCECEWQWSLDALLVCRWCGTAVQPGRSGQNAGVKHG